MAPVLIILIVVGWFVMAYGLWRALRLLGGWRPAVANVWQSDYDEAERARDRASFSSMARTTSWTNDDDDDVVSQRTITEAIVYTTADGEEHRGEVKRRVVRGSQPSTVYTVWYEEADPDNVTANGPWYWFMLVLGGAAMMAAGATILVRTGGAVTFTTHTTITHHTTL